MQDQFYKLPLFQYLNHFKLFANDKFDSWLFYCYKATFIETSIFKQNKESFLMLEEMNILHFPKFDVDDPQKSLVEIQFEKFGNYIMETNQMQTLLLKLNYSKQQIKRILHFYSQGTEKEKEKRLDHICACILFKDLQKFNTKQIDDSFRKFLWSKKVCKNAPSILQ